MNTETAVPVDATKSELLALLYSFVNKRPCLDFANYGDVSIYRAEVRMISRQRSDALLLLRAVSLRDSITAAEMVAAFRNRLTLGRTKKGQLCLDYCAGQYYATEYRAAVAQYAASLLWSYMRSNMPAPIVKKEVEGGHTYEHEYFDGLRAGPWLRSHFRREFGRGVASRWFN
jgi:hypothetical protein